jgi:hypothetical protein
LKALAHSFAVGESTVATAPQSMHSRIRQHSSMAVLTTIQLCECKFDLSRLIFSSLSVMMSVAALLNAISAVTKK